MKYPCSLALIGVASHQTLRAFSSDFPHERFQIWFSHRIPRTFFGGSLRFLSMSPHSFRIVSYISGALGAGVGLSTCLLHNVSVVPPKYREVFSYFVPAFCAGMIWGVTAPERWGLGKGVLQGTALGLAWIFVKRSWEQGHQGMFVLDPHHDMNWKVNHISRPT